MPGYDGHVAVAELVYRRLRSSMPLDKIKFMSGNLIPDLAKVDKRISHYRRDASIRGLYVPDMERVEQEFLVINNPIKLGMFSHFYTDHSFIEDFLIPEFEWSYERMKIVNPRNHLEWDPEPFFRKDGFYYRGFKETNHLLVRDGFVNMETIDELPEILHNTGIDTFDKRSEKTWKAELEEYMNGKEEYTGNVFDYEHLKNWIQQTSVQLANKIISKVG